jgi:hypothetical protein
MQVDLIRCVCLQPQKGLPHAWYKLEVLGGNGASKICGWSPTDTCCAYLCTQAHLEKGENCRSCVWRKSYVQILERQDVADLL